MAYVKTAPPGAGALLATAGPALAALGQVVAGSGWWRSRSWCSWWSIRCCGCSSSASRTASRRVHARQLRRRPTGAAATSRRCGNSLVLGVSAAALCLLFGVPMAWALSRTDMPGKGIIWTPSWAPSSCRPTWARWAGSCWPGPNAGWLNRAVVALTGADGPVQHLLDARAGAGGRLLQLSLRVRADQVGAGPGVLGDGGRRQHPGRRQPAHDAVRSRCRWCCRRSWAPSSWCSWRRSRYSARPRCWPCPARFHVVTTQLWQFFEFPPKVGVAAAYAMPLLMITVVLFWLQRRITQSQGLRVADRQGRRAPEVPLGPLEMAGARLLPASCARCPSSCRWW